MDRKEWLASLKVGDEVDCSKSVQKVARLTPTQIIVHMDGNARREIRFNREDGRQRSGGSSWSRTTLHPLTDEARNRYEHRDLSQWLRYLQHEKLTLTQLRAIRAIVKDDL